MASLSVVVENTDSREVRELRLLFEVSQILGQSFDFAEVAQPILKAMAEHLNMVRGTISLLNERTNTVEIKAAYGLSTSQLQRGVYKLGEGVTGAVVETGEAAIVPKVTEEPLFLNRTGARPTLSKSDISCAVTEPNIFPASPIFFFV